MSFDKHKTVCATCGYLWRTRTTAPDKVVCPKCHPKVCHGKADTRQRVDCPCGHSWTTRSAPDTAVCPKCSGKGASPHVWVTKVEDIPAPVQNDPAPPSGKRTGNGWTPRGDGTLEYRGFTQVYRPEQAEQHRERLETALFNAGWRLVARPWLEQGDSLFESGTRRILTDRVGVFMYKWEGSGWLRFAACGGYEKQVALGAFEQ